MEILKVLISDACDDRCAEILRRAGCDVTVKTDFTKDQLVAAIKDYDALVVRSATKVTADVINAGTRLKVIGRAGTGVDNIDCTAATARGVLVINAPGGNTLSAAEMTCALLVATSRDVAAACASLKAGRWDRKAFMANELSGKTLGIVGLGRIGREVAVRMQAFGMRTIGYDPVIPAEAAAQFGVEAMSLEELWPACDYITVHTPLIACTRNLINASTLSRCKKGVKIINCARGGIVNEQDLLAALESGQASGAGFDVFEEEPPTNAKFIAHPKVICTPHLGANTREAQARVAIEIAEQFVALKAGCPIAGAVNAPLLAQSQAADHQPLGRLAADLGKIAAALAATYGGGGPLELVVETCLSSAGGGAKKSLDGRMTKFLAAASLVGALQGLGEGQANFINQEALAKDRKLTAVAQPVADGDHSPCASCPSGSPFSIATDWIRLTVRPANPQSSTWKSHVLVGSPGNVSLLHCVDGGRFDGGLALTGRKIVALGPVGKLADVVGAVKEIGAVAFAAATKVPPASSAASFYVIDAGDVCPKRKSAPAPLTRWTACSF